ncbi:uncharacterized protein RAG0_15363 [Rhynchosporium agropyri]|uniref:Uncharacterized protein n=1 Tax=Rhynchosporium agropyri TaxID=914238 RepID=A0A1E1LKS3_9HELO|nr:uncharacterized protein RAG0_15363 [Rhynchosporium agropyri]
MLAPTYKQYRVVIKKGKRTQLTYLTTSSDDTARVGMVKLTISPYYTGLPRILHSLSPSSLESQNTFKEIIIDSSIPNPGLTKSFNNPSLMAHVLFASVGEQFLHPRSVNAIGSQKEAILVKRCVTLFGGLCAMMAALILSILVGALVGLLARDAIVGIMIAAGVGALVACVEAYVMHAFQ